VKNDVSIPNNRTDFIISGNEIRKLLNKQNKFRDDKGVEKLREPKKPYKKIRACGTCLTKVLRGLILGNETYQKSFGHVQIYLNLIWKRTQ
jgi:hypothetical protein